MTIFHKYFPSNVGGTENSHKIEPFKNSCLWKQLLCWNTWLKIYITITEDVGGISLSTSAHNFVYSIKERPELLSGSITGIKKEWTFNRTLNTIRQRTVFNDVITQRLHLVFNIVLLDEVLHILLQTFFHIYVLMINDKMLKFIITFFQWLIMFAVLNAGKDNHQKDLYWKLVFIVQYQVRSECNSLIMIF